jgi:hypothetical protein
MNTSYTSKRGAVMATTEGSGQLSDSHAKAIRQYVVYQLKLIELLHIWLLSFHLRDSGLVPENVMGHGTDRFVETLLGLQAITFMSIADANNSTNIRTIWKVLFPLHAEAIDRVWSRSIQPGQDLMKSFRDQAGAHGDKPEKYFAGKLSLMRNSGIVLKSLQSFNALSICLLKRQAKELPEMESDIETALLGIELALGNEFVFNREWLREMHLIPKGSYRKIFR